MATTWWLVGVGVVLLLLVVIRVAQSARRFGRANATLSAANRRSAADLRALMNSRRPHDE